MYNSRPEGAGEAAVTETEWEIFCVLLALLWRCPRRGVPLRGCGMAGLATGIPKDALENFGGAEELRSWRELGHPGAQGL